MKGLLALVGMVLFTALALLAPTPAPLLLAVVGFAFMRSGRRGFLLLALTATLLNVLIVGATVKGPPLIDFLPLSRVGIATALEASSRLLGALAANLAILTWIPPAQLLDGTPMPRTLRAHFGALLIAAHDIQRDFQRILSARRLRGHWPRGRLARVRETARLLPLLLVSAHERGLARRDALRLAGIDVGARFAPVLAIAALAAAGRLALLAVPNVALTYVVVFLGGVVFGSRVGALGGLLGMAVTDFLLTGLYPAGFVNAPAMALLGFAGGAMRRVNFRSVEGAMLAASVGIAGTFVFSVAVDSMTWVLVLRDQPAAWKGLVMAGLAFNAIPALVNGALFAIATGPAVAAMHSREHASSPARPSESLVS